MLSTVMSIKNSLSTKMYSCSRHIYSEEHSFFPTWRFNCWYQQKPLPQWSHTCGSFLVCLMTCFCKLRTSRLLYAQQSQYHHTPSCFFTCFCSSESHLNVLSQFAAIHLNDLSVLCEYLWAFSSLLNAKVCSQSSQGNFLSLCLYECRSWELGVALMWSHSVHGTD